MNILLWVLQALAALLYGASGVMTDDQAQQWRPR